MSLFRLEISLFPSADPLWKAELCAERISTPSANEPINPTRKLSSLLGAVEGELETAEFVEDRKLPLWNRIYMGDVLLKLNDFLLFDNEDFVNLRIEIKEKVALTVLPLSPLRSFLRS